MYSFPIMFDHVEMAFFRVRIIIEGEVCTSFNLAGDEEWRWLSQSIDAGIFLSQSAAQRCYENLDIWDYDAVLTEDFTYTVRLEKWSVDECNAAEDVELIAEKTINPYEE